MYTKHEIAQITSRQATNEHALMVLTQTLSRLNVKQILHCQEPGGRSLARTLALNELVGAAAAAPPLAV